MKVKPYTLMFPYTVLQEEAKGGESTYIKGNRVQDIEEIWWEGICPRQEPQWTTKDRNRREHGNSIFNCVKSPHTLVFDDYSRYQLLVRGAEWRQVVTV